MAMKQQDLGLNLNKRRTRKAVLLDEKNLAAPCSGLLALISPHAPRAKTGRAPFELETMLRIHFVRQWFGLSEPAMPEALFETALYRGFVGLSSVERIPERVSILRLRRLLKEHQPAEQILAAVNATLTGKGLMFRERHGGGRRPDVFADAGYQGVAKREDTQGITAQWHVAMRPGKRRALDKSTPLGAILHKLEQAKARIRAKAEHPFW